MQMPMVHSLCLVSYSILRAIRKTVVVFDLICWLRESVRVNIFVTVGYGMNGNETIQNQCQMEYDDEMKRKRRRENAINSKMKMLSPREEWQLLEHIRRQQH